MAAVHATEVGVYIYRAADPATGRVEHEYDHVLVGRVPADAAARRRTRPRWPPLAGSPATTLAECRRRRYAPWLAGVLGIAPADFARHAGQRPACVVTEDQLRGSRRSRLR